MVGNIIETGNAFGNKQLLYSNTVTSIPWKTGSYTPTGYKEVSGIFKPDSTTVAKIHACKMIMVEIDDLHGTVLFTDIHVIDLESMHSSGASNARTERFLSTNSVNAAGLIAMNWIIHSGSNYFASVFYCDENETSNIMSLTVKIYKLA